VNDLEKRIHFLAAELRENHIEEHRIRKELEKIIEEFQHGYTV
jgi:uncharacterized protein YoaH (UPF0181 family)